MKFLKQQDFKLIFNFFQTNKKILFIVYNIVNKYKNRKSNLNA